MRARLSLLVFMTSCTGLIDEPLVSPPRATRITSFSNDCDAGDQAFVRRVIVGVLGRRPASQGEVDAYVDALDKLQRDGNDAIAARRAVVEALTHQEAFRIRWSDFLKDTLRVARTQTKSSSDCYGASDGAVADDGAIARYVRDHDASEQEPPKAGFTMRELLASALALDDLSVLYRANLFAMLGKPMNGSTSPIELEQARRNDFGAAFEGVYTRRDVVCLSCHTGEHSVTSSPDPATNRFWPIATQLERTLFGASSSADAARARGMLRHWGVAGGGVAPFGWSPSCGTFTEPQTDDPLGVEAHFGAIRGLRTSVWDLERSLHRGIDGLGRGSNEDPDQAFAYLVAMAIVERVWTELVGSPLTVAHQFPRTAAQRDVLRELADAFLARHFSLRQLIAAITTHPLFNLESPSAGCGASAYPLPRVFNPWTDMDSDVAARGNGPSDQVHPLSPRLLRRSLFSSLEWPAYEEYPSAGSAEETLALGLGFFMRDGEPGHRAFDFTGRLAWESAYGACPKLGADDFISRLVTASSGAQVRDAVLVLKDRLIGQPSIDPAEEPLLEALLGTSLDGAASSGLDPQLRKLCGALIASPWFMLEGIVPDDARAAPRLTRPEHGYAAACEWLVHETDLSCD